MIYSNKILWIQILFISIFLQMSYSDCRWNWRLITSSSILTISKYYLHVDLNNTFKNHRNRWKCEDGLIIPIQSRSITDSGTNSRNQQMFNKQSHHPNPAKVHYWLRSPRVSNRPYRKSPKFSQGPLKQSTDVKSYIYSKPNDE